ncbi:YagK/YfjJ domain-containing protein [Shewanella litorisediminis]|uniref:Inovirus-type Gp2 protein n=1 Tax=Shewanella litorisediminis TaxID=1173586 RepID=A0ABX7G2S0_9GAMM|nr:inovirus-type Gp2 protein [Shewanella litorisediminis]MCL2918609.1 inovirus Gp2 family protein [Shewanella litorisediminis]QRH01433.1 inovirus-type Gp2 protein [Shewanella litorisediminis]
MKRPAVTISPGTESALSHANTPTEDVVIKGRVWKIMSFPEGINRPLLNRLYDQLDAFLSRHSKVYMIRFDISLYDSSPHNHEISKLRSFVVKSLKSHYKSSVDFGWVREQNTTDDKCHYHCFVLLNGHNADSTNTTFDIVRHAVELVVDINAHFPENCGYMIERHSPESFQAALFRLSYLAKNATKEGKPGAAKGYYFSRIKRKG